MTAETFSHIAPGIPLSPGVYRYYDAANQLIYVGKARQLRKRISSYFNKPHDNFKTAELVRRIHRIEFTIVNSEQDAFLLENSLIKEYKPLFNINLKDDKTYPYIVIKNEPFPRVFFTRRKINDGSIYLGPYTSVMKVRELLDFIKQNIPLRTCNLALTASNIQKGKFKVCLEYHLGNCKGPCEGLQTVDDYDDGIERIRSILKGNIGPVLQEYKRLMKEHAEHLAFEEAARYQEKIRHLQEYQSGSMVVNARLGTMDVFAILEEGDMAYVHYLAINHGSIIHTRTITLEKKLEETREEVLLYAIAQLRAMYQSEAKEIIVSQPIDYPQEDIRITVPRSGDKKKLLELCEKNVQHFKSALDARKMLRLEDKTEEEKEAVLLQLQDDLHLPAFPSHIECFDNSNLHGTDAVAAMVCFKNGEPSKADYRKFNIKTVTGINDFASMQEVVYRRYKRLTDDQAPLPQLVIIDGGKGQLNAALQSIRALGLDGQMTVVGLAKNQEEIFFPGDQESIKLPWDSESLKLIRRVRDEVHRFGLGFHRQKRSKSAIRHELDDIPGIGQATREELLKTFKSMKRIREAGLSELESVIGRSRAAALYKAMHAPK